MDRKQEPWQIKKARELLAELPGVKPEKLADWNMRASALMAFSGALIGEELFSRKAGE